MSENQAKKAPKVLIALATYNEIDNLPKLLRSLRSQTPNADVLVVDDNSPDGTGRWAEEESRTDSRVHTVIRTNERGLGSAVIRALQYAIDNDYDYVVNMDADFSHPIDALPKLLEKVEESTPKTDVVIGSRYIPGGATPDWPLRRRIMSRCVNMFARLTLGLKTKDNSGSYRCYRVEKLRELDFDRFVSSGYSFFEETLFRLKLVGATFEEIPIIFVDRRHGKSKINRKEAVRAIWIMSILGLRRFCGLERVKRQ